MSRLPTVLRLRELTERRALGAVAGGQRDVLAAKEELAARVQEIQALSSPAGRPLSALELRTLELRGLAHHDLVVDATSEVELAEDRQAELIRAWSHASAQRKSVERLTERRRVEAAHAARAAADRALDEAVLLRRGTA
jgi:flagellar biosynthesis chaperone FliJ